MSSPMVVATHGLKCSAHTSAGHPCRSWAIRGGTVCATHGGQAPQVKHKARERLLAAADPVAAELVRLALHSDSEAVRVQAARDILDRAGLAVRQLISAEVTHHDGDSELDRAIEGLLAGMGPVEQGAPAVEAERTS